LKLDELGLKKKELSKMTSCQLKQLLKVEEVKSNSPKNPITEEEEKTVMQAFKHDLFKKIKTIERKERKDKLVLKMAEYGSVYGQQGATKIPGGALEEKQD
jgi:hypothetical protein